MEVATANPNPNPKPKPKPKPNPSPSPNPSPNPNPNPNRDGGVRAEAQYVVGTNAEDGWVDAMQRYVLDRLSTETK